MTIQPHSTQPEVSPQTTGLVWFRRDLRNTDNAALFYALKHCDQVHCAFIFDKTILDKLPSKKDRRVEFIWESIKELKEALIKQGGDLHILYDHAEQALPKLAEQLKVSAVFTNKDYEPAAIERDKAVTKSLKEKDIEFYAFKDQVIFEESEVLTKTGGTFSVFSPYKNAWFKKLEPFHLKPYPSEKSSKKLVKPGKTLPLPSLKDMGFERTNILELIEPGMSGALNSFDDFLNRINQYKTTRDFPAVKGVSYLSVHNRFGTLSIRRAAKAAHDRFEAKGCEGALGWLNELIWRDFYFQIIFHRPQAATNAFKPEYDAIEWEKGEKAKKLFKAWCDGQTGYPLVDAAMRQLNQTGYQHNRLRMVTASFLTKDLGVDWRWGEQYFADQLNDYDLSANNGGWQWAASSGCDAQPYFRIFNPVSQSEKFDPDGKFIRKYCPEIAKLSKKFIHKPWECPPIELSDAQVELDKTYPRPVVDHAEARKKTLERYEVVKKQKD
ncbi:MAG: deoxyribodipyrimidine photo-lyase [Limnobacter sp.]|nr:deoxyribodipyrimidine photo-lyase [Limnobacter sp.]